MKELIVNTFLILGALLHVLSALGILRYNDFLIRLHASSKASTLGVGFFLTATAIDIWDLTVTVKLIFSMIFIFLTSSVIAHLFAKAYILGKDDSD